MNLIEQRQSLIDKRTSKAEKERVHKLNNLVNRIETVMRDPDVIAVLEKHLVESGMVELKEFGCLCQGGFCSWQKGLNQRLRPLINEWEAKGVQVHLGITMTLRLPPNRMHSTLNGNTLSYYFKLHKMAIPSHLNLRKEV